MTFRASEISGVGQACDTSGVVPARRPYSVRRAISVDVDRPMGRSGDIMVAARGTDLLTLGASEDVVRLVEESLQARITSGRVIQEVEAAPGIPGLENLVGRNSLRGLRAAIRQEVDGEAIAARPARVMLDDLVGISIIADVAWLYWPDAAGPVEAETGKQIPPVGTCVGFRPGASSLAGTFGPEDVRRVPHLNRGGDQDAFHALPSGNGPGIRRIRRIDVWVDDEIHIEAMFQDSASLPDGGRAGIHEYALTATVERSTRRVLTVMPQPVLLPYRECFDAPASLAALVGMPLAELRDSVLVQLKGTAGCTHLNDAARALAEAGELADMLGRA